jgi:hypothetical protein
MLGMKRFRSASITIAGLMHGLEKVSSHSEGYESKTIGRQQSGMQFSPPEPRNDPERSFH